METTVVTSLISGFFALATALGSVWLKHYLEQPRVTKGEMRQPPPPAASPKSAAPTTSAISFVRPILIFVVSFAVGALDRHLKVGGAKDMPATIVFYCFLGLSFLTLVFTHRRSSASFWPYQLDAISLWAAFASGYLFANGRFWSDVFVSTAMFWLGYAVIGGLLVRLTRPRNALT